MEFKGTKGKWELYPNSSWNHGSTKSGFVICMRERGRGNLSAFAGAWTPFMSMTDDECKANAIIISKAPEMLEMLQRVNESLLNDSFSLEQMDLRKDVELLIKQATEL